MGKAKKVEGKIRKKKGGEGAGEEKQDGELSMSYATLERRR